VSARPKAPRQPGAPKEPWWKTPALLLGLLLMVAAFGLLLSVPHPVTLMASKVLS